MHAQLKNYESKAESKEQWNNGVFEVERLEFPPEVWFLQPLKPDVSRPALIIHFVISVYSALAVLPVDMRIRLYILWERVVLVFLHIIFIICR